MKYVDAFVLPVPKKNLPAYRRMARQAGKIWREYGALDYKESASATTSRARWACRSRA